MVKSDASPSQSCLIDNVDWDYNMTVLDVSHIFDEQTDYYSIFCQGTKVYNVTIKGEITVNKAGQTGIVLGETSDITLLYGIEIDVQLKSNGDIGGLVANVNHKTDIKYCTIKGKLDGGATGSVGGLIGYINADLYINVSTINAFLVAKPTGNDNQNHVSAVVAIEANSGYIDINNVEANTTV